MYMNILMIICQYIDDKYDTVVIILKYTLIYILIIYYIFYHIFKLIYTCII